MQTIFFATIASPYGTLRLHERNNAIVALDWIPFSQMSSLTPLLREAKAQLKAYFSGKLKSFQLPLDSEGTSFQKNVWRLLQNISYGKTCSYGNIAQKIPSSPRSVGHACACNPIPIIIPCHRVICKNQQMGGYSGGQGIKTKKALLALEQQYH